MRYIAVPIAVLAIVVAILAMTNSPAPDARACTGGFYGSLEHLAQSSDIFLAEAAVVGDTINRAPTITPTATPTQRDARTPEPTPPSPPEAPHAPPTASIPFDVSGFGATLRLRETYVGVLSGSVDVDWTQRAFIEREARQKEAGLISDCSPGQFSYRYLEGQEYLVFAGEFEALGLTTFARFQVDGPSLIVLDPDIPFLSMTLDTYERFFAALPSESMGDDTSVYVTADRVPLASVLRAVAYLRNDPRIYPPDTGSAGLLPAP